MKKKIIPHTPYKVQQDCSYQGEALKVPTAFYRLWSSNNINNIKIKSNKINEKLFFLKFENFSMKIIPPHAI